MRVRYSHPIACFAVVLLAASTLLTGAAHSKDVPKGAPQSAALLLGKRAGQERSDNFLSMKLVWCPAGKFTMGVEKQQGLGQVEVTFARGFWIGQYEVIQHASRCRW